MSTSNVEAKSGPHVAVVIPCYRVKRYILDVISKIGAICQTIYVVDDCCPEQTGEFVIKNNYDKRVVVLFHQQNQGVGAATLTGMCRAIEDGATVVVKIDGDGQMDPSLINCFIQPILRGEADYAKGNRFYYLDTISRMPRIRLLGNAVLSFLTKISSGYWNIFDPTNGFTAIHVNLLKELPLHKISRRFFFESDLLFRLYIMRAVVIDIPMHASYGDESSNLEIQKIVFSFLGKHISNTFKRIIYTYFLRDFSIASLYLVFGIFLTIFGTAFGVSRWYSLALQGIEASAGTVMLAGLPIILGFQLLLSFVAFDVANLPQKPICARLARHY